MRLALIAPVLAVLPLASALCHNSISCLLNGNTGCNNVCIRQGNENGGRCTSRDGCPGYDMCACYPRSKRSDEVIDGDAPLREILKDAGVLDEVDKLDARDTELDKRSICCSFPDPVGGLCCENHCLYIGKPGGQCSDKKVCTCN